MSNMETHHISSDKNIKDILIQSSEDNYSPEATTIVFDGCMIALCEATENRFSTNGTQHTAKKGDVIILPPMAMTHFESQEEGITSNWMLVAYPIIMNLPKKLVKTFFSDIRKNPVIRCRLETYKVIQRHFDSMKDLNKDKDNSNRIEIISCMLATLLYILEAENRHNGSPQDNHQNKKHQTLSEQFFELMFRDFRKDRTVKYYAWQMNISTHYLSRIIHQQTGRTIKDWIADTLMVEIKYYLTCTDKTIEEISETLSFCSPSAFIQYFKSQTGYTPFKYRRESSASRSSNSR